MFSGKTCRYYLILVLLILPTIGLAQLTFGPGPEQPNSALDSIVAVVNNDIITRRELEAATAQIQRQIQQKKVPLPPRDQLETQVLERLIIMHLQQRAAEQHGISIDDATLNAAIESVAQRNKMTLTQLQQTIEKDGADFAQFRDDVRQELLAGRLRQKLVDSQIHISEQDVASLQAQVAKTTPTPERNANSGQRQYHIAQILLATPESATPQQIAEVKRKAEQVLSQLRKGEDFRQIAAGMSAGQQALEGGDLGWRDAEQLPTIFANVVPKMRPGDFSELIRSPSGFHIVRLIEVRGGAALPAETRAAEPSSAQVQQQTRARHILLKTSPTRSDEQVRQGLEQLRQQIVAGADFAELARTHSEDKVSGAQGGDLGWSRPGMMVPEFEKTLDSLQINEISAPFKTRFGWHIVQAQERRQGGTESERVKEALFRRRSDEEWQQWQRRLRDEAYVEIRLPNAAKNGIQP